jgi:hypothetical protein
MSPGKSLNKATALVALSHARYQYLKLYQDEQLGRLVNAMEDILCDAFLCEYSISILLGSASDLMPDRC